MTDFSDYVCDHYCSVQFVSMEIDAASGEAVSVSGLAKKYDIERRQLHADLSRVKRNEKNVKTDYDANVWLINKALQLMAEYFAVEERDGDRWVSFKPGVSFDDLVFRGDKVHRPQPDEHALLRNPFDPNSGVFSDNIRKLTGKDETTDLRESMQSFGWHPKFPALVDERGVVLVGNRRMAIAKELGIEPVTETVTLGKGDAADAERFKLALISNIGSKPFTKSDRRRIAEYLYSEVGEDWTMQRIADALNVSKKTISKDLEGVVTHGNNLDRPKGGRPKGSTKPKPAPTETVSVTVAQADRAPITVGVKVEPPAPAAPPHAAPATPVDSETAWRIQQLREIRRDHAKRLTESIEKIESINAELGKLIAANPGWLARCKEDQERERREYEEVMARMDEAHATREAAEVADAAERAAEDAPANAEAVQ